MTRHKVVFVGAGPGDPELITLKAKRMIETADVIVYSGSLLNPKLLEYANNNAELVDAAKIDREKIFEFLKDETKRGKFAIRLHDGDPALFSAIREQIDKLEKGIKTLTSTFNFTTHSSMNLETSVLQSLRYSIKV